MVRWKGKWEGGKYRIGIADWIEGLGLALSGIALLIAARVMELKQ